MVSLLRRMRQTSTLLAIRTGSGSYTLPKEVARINLRFAPKLEGGHGGARKFWRHELVRLKYHNPAVPMTVDRAATQDDPAVMTVFFTGTDTTSGSKASDTTKTTRPAAPTVSTSGDKTASEHEPFERTETISMSNAKPEAILSELVRVTKATAVPVTEEDQAELEALEVARRRSQRDSALSHERNRAKKAEEELLKQARGELV